VTDRLLLLLPGGQGFVGMSWFISACEALFTWQNWPVIVISIGMVLAGVIDWWIFKVPNKLTYPLIISGWALGLWHSFNHWFGWDLRIDAGTGGIGSSLLGTLVAFLLLFFVYFVGGVGAGDVKMQMGFGSWIGAFFGVERTAEPRFFGEGNALSIIWWAFCAGVIAGGIIGLGMILVRRQFKKNLDHTREILTDLVKAGPVEASKRAGERRSRWHKLPYGIPLCIGFVGYLFYLYSQQAQ
jgi:prepilin peptidase CpaA